MSPSRRARAGALSTVPLTLVVLLSGCAGTGGTESATGAGTAVRVGDESVRLVDVDRASDGICRATSADLAERNEAYPLGVVRRYAVRTLAIRLQVEQWAEARGVEPGAEYESGREQVEAQAASIDLPEELRDPYVQVESSQALIQDVAVQVGSAVLTEKGVAMPGPEEAFEAGAMDFDAWAAEQSKNVRIDPRFGLVLRDGLFVVEETGSSVAVSEAAVQGLSDQVSAEYAANLPESQRCGG